MSGIGEFAYTLLLGWVRGLVDWFWSLAGGGGGAGILQWFLSNWKVWLLVLLGLGLVVDWITWLIRWRPYRLLFGRPTQAVAGSGEEAEAWDSGVGYYENETAADEDGAEWAETTFATLSEVDPHWSDTFVSSGEGDLLYDPDFIPQQLTQAERIAAAAEEFWAGGDYVPDSGAIAYGHGEWAEDGEDYAGEPAAPDMPPAQPAPDAEDHPAAAWIDPDTPQAAWADAQAGAYAAGETTDQASPAKAQALEDAAYGDEAVYAQASDESPADTPYDEAYDESYNEPYTGTEEAAMQNDQDGPVMYGRPGLWPGMQYPFAGQEADAEAAPVDAQEAGQPAPSEAPAAEPYDPLFNPDAQAEAAPAPRRRRRRLHQADTAWQPDDAVAPAKRAHDVQPAPEWSDNDAPYRRPQADAAPRSLQRPAAEPSLDDTRPSRVVRPANEPPMPPPRRARKGRDDLKTVTGKPARPRGLRRFTSTQDDPIAGLPPLDLTNPFLPPVRPQRHGRDE